MVPIYHRSTLYMYVYVKWDNDLYMVNNEKKIRLIYFYYNS